LSQKKWCRHGDRACDHQKAHGSYEESQEVIHLVNYYKAQTKYPFINQVHLAEVILAQVEFVDVDDFLCLTVIYILFFLYFQKIKIFTKFTQYTN